MSDTNLQNTKSNRRNFLKLSLLGSAIATTQVFGNDDGRILREATSSELKENFPNSKKIKTICTHCSVGCGIIAEVNDDVWVRQEVAQDHPISQGGHCCKGADMIDRVRSTTRLRYPIEKVNGEWQKTTWDSSMDKIAKKLSELREKHGPDSVMFIGSAKVSNEQSYYIRKFAAFFGTNNIDHQARI